MIFLILIFIILLIPFSFFIFPQLSPIPYFPTNKKDSALIIKNLNLKNNHLIIDLGAGDGIVIFAAARKAFQNKLNTKFVAVEINPVLILILHLRRLFHPNKKNIKIIQADMFKINFKTFKLSNFITFYLYISPWLLEKAVNNIKAQISNFQIVSYMYPIPKWDKNLNKTIEGRNKIFIYNE